MTARRLIKRADRLFDGTERRNAENEWTVLAEFISPQQSGVFRNALESPGTKRTTRLYDSTALGANTDLAAAIHSTLTNPTTKWSKIRYKDEQLNNDPSAVEWLEDTNNKIHEFLNESNFDTQVSKNYQMLTSLGTMILIQESKVEEGEFETFQFTSWHLSQVAFSENADGIVDTVYRKFRLTARQAFEKWGTKVADEVMEALKDAPDKEFEYMHAIFPRDPKEVKLNDFGLAPGKDRPFASVYLDLTKNTIVSEGGYYEFPAYVVRWQTSPSEIYGRGPGHNALPDIRTINRVRDLGLHTLAKVTHPPILASSRNVLGTLDLRPGKLNVVRDPDGVQEFVSKARFDITQFSVEDLKASIRSLFFIDKLLLPPRTETGEMTAFEVGQRLAQMQRVLGPTLSRLNSEFLTPLIVRSFKILLREGRLRPLPPILQQAGLNVDIKFVNQLSRSQQIDDVTNIQGWVQDMAGLAQVKPEVLDYIDADGIAKHTAKLRGVPEIAVANDQEVAALREQRAQQQQAAQALEAGVKAADIASKTEGLDEV